jgi:hypothetical protein
MLARHWSASYRQCLALRVDPLLQSWTLSRQHPLPVFSAADVGSSLRPEQVAVQIPPSPGGARILHTCSPCIGTNLPTGVVHDFGIWFRLCPCGLGKAHLGITSPGGRVWGREKRFWLPNGMDTVRNVGAVMWEDPWRPGAISYPGFLATGVHQDCGPSNLALSAPRDNCSGATTSVQSGHHGGLAPN